MPYKNIEDRRAAWRRWKERHREKRREQQRAQKLAAYAHPEIQHCSNELCSAVGERHHPNYSKPKEIIWLCKRHHEELHHNRVCEVDECGRKHLARGMCVMHYERWRRATGRRKKK